MPQWGLEPRCGFSHSGMLVPASVPPHEH